MSTPTTRTKLTYDDYALIPDDGKKHEIIDGEEYVTPAPRTRHQRISVQLVTILNSYVRKTKAGEIFHAPTDVLLSKHDIVQPDIIFIASNRRAIVTEVNVKGAPDLVIEILSQASRKLDEGRKLHVYGEAGVKELWVVDPESESVCVYQLSKGKLVKSVELSTSAEDVLRSPLLPGLKITLAEVFEKEL